MGYQRGPASVRCFGRHLALLGHEITISIITYQSVILNKTLKIINSLYCTTITLLLSSVLCQNFSYNVQRRAAPSVFLLFRSLFIWGAWKTRRGGERERRLYIVASWFVLLRLRCVMLCNREDLKGWLAAEQSEKAWRQAQRFPVAAFATLS